MNNQPKITIITVTFNALENLQKTIKSVEAQDYQNLEYIVVDGGSKDGSKEFIESKKDSINKWVSEPDGGIYDAMNKGVKMASGEYCIFMNAGDTFVSSASISEVFAKESDADVIYGDIMKNGQLKKSLSPRNCHKMFYCHQAVFTRISCLKEYPFDVKHRYSADFKQAKQLFLAGKSFAYVDLAVADFDTGGVSNVSR